MKKEIRKIFLSAMIGLAISCCILGFMLAIVGAIHDLPGEMVQGAFAIGLGIAGGVYVLTCLESDL